MFKWWDVLPDNERQRWTLDPFVSVGPLSFGMSPDEVMRSASDFEIPNSGASWRSVKSVRQYAATSGTRSSRGGRAPRPASADRVRSLAAQGGHQLAEAARAQPGERACPGRL